MINKNFFYRHRYWILIIAAFLLVRIFIFYTYWQASINQGGWDNFFNHKWSQASSGVFAMKFHEICDWHPPLYYAFASSILFLFHSVWFLYGVQLILSFVSLLFVYKIARLFLSEKLALIAGFILVLEPYWAWNNLLITSENLSTPLFLGGFYFFLKSLKSSPIRNIVYSAILLALATLTRPNTYLLTVALSLLMIVIFLLRNKLKLIFLSNFNFKKFLIYLLVFNLIFFVFLSPWMVRNKVVYDRFTLANILSTNMYFYNLPALLSFKDGITYSQANALVKGQAYAALGENVGDQGNCQLFSKEEFNAQLNYYQSSVKKYIFANLPLYTEMHLVKTLPFFVMSGYSDMWYAYGGEFKKPDVSSAILAGNFKVIWNFVSAMNLKIIVYLGGSAFWLFCSMSLIFACFYSYFKDKDKFILFVFFLFIALYNGLITSPFLMARYRLPIYGLFFIALVYSLSAIIKEVRLKYGKSR